MNSSLVRAYVGLGSNLNNPVAQVRSALAALDTHLSAHELLQELHMLEAHHGRVRGEERWGPRTLDLDLLLYGNQSHSCDKLTVPHPGLPQRDFVLYPLHEIAPGLDIPGAGSLRHLMERCTPLGLQPLHAAV